MAVVAVAVAGRDAGRPAPADRAADPSGAAIGAVASRPDDAVAAAGVAVALGGETTTLPTPAATRRSDWPAAIAAAQRPAADGYVNRFTIDDVGTPPRPLDTTPPWVRRMDLLTNARIHPYER